MQKTPAKKMTEIVSRYNLKQAGNASGKNAEHIYFRAIKFRTKWCCLKLKCLTDVWQLRFTKFLYSCSYVLGMFDIMYLYMYFYFLLEKAKLEAYFVAIILVIGGTF